MHTRKILFFICLFTLQSQSAEGTAPSYLETHPKLPDGKKLEEKAQNYFRINEPFAAVLLLDKYLKNNPKLFLEFWRIWGEFQVDPHSSEINLKILESKIHHLDSSIPDSKKSSVQSELPYFQTRLLLFQEFQILTQLQLEPTNSFQQEYQRKKLFKIHSTLRNRSTIFHEDIPLFHHISGRIRNNWSQDFFIKTDISSGISTSPLPKELDSPPLSTKTFHSLNTRFSYSPWITIFPESIQPHFNFLTYSKLYYPDSEQSLSIHSLLARTGTRIHTSHFSADIRGAFQISLQSDTLYPNYPIYNENQFLELEFSFNKNWGFIFNTGQELFREKQYSRFKWETGLFFKIPFGNAAASSMFIFGNYKAHNTWNNFQNGIAISILAFRISPRLTLRHQSDIEYRYFPYENISSIREDLIIKQTPSLGIQLTDQLSASLNYSFVFKRLRNVKASINAQKNTYLFKDHQIFVKFNWTKPFFFSNFTPRSTGKTLPPWYFPESYKQTGNENFNSDEFNNMRESSDAVSQDCGCRD
jgi:hypothetical protein